MGADSAPAWRTTIRTSFGYWAGPSSTRDIGRNSLNTQRRSRIRWSRPGEDPRSLRGRSGAVPAPETPVFRIAEADHLESRRLHGPRPEGKTGTEFLRQADPPFSPLYGPQLPPEPW